MAKKTHTSKQTKNPIKEAKEKEKKKNALYSKEQQADCRLFYRNNGSQRTMKYEENCFIWRQRSTYKNPAADIAFNGESKLFLLGPEMR